MKLVCPKCGYKYEAMKGQAVSCNGRRSEASVGHALTAMREVKR